jgi:16S rRNA (guanine966-N2)-methyltransferase
MRIIGGAAKGRALSSVVGPIRPTSDRAREALFSTLHSEFGDFEGLHFLDLFAGSGAVGLEALSRSAAVVHAVEKSEGAGRTISKNSDLVMRGHVLGEFHHFSMSVQKFLESPALTSYNIVYIDPPYDFSDSDLYKCLKELREGDFLTDDAFIAVERSRKSSPPQWPVGLVSRRVRNYGQAVIYYAAMVGENG